MALNRVLEGERGIRRLHLEREARVVVVQDRNVGSRRRFPEHVAKPLELEAELLELPEAAALPPVGVQHPVPVLLGAEARGAPAEVDEQLGAVPDRLVAEEAHLPAAG